MGSKEQRRAAKAMRSFNTTGPVRPEEHYCIPPLQRLDLDGVLELIRGGRYFVLHAPRQTGKTSAMLALRDLLNDGGEFRCLYVNVEAAQASRENLSEAMATILTELRRRARITFRDDAMVNLVAGVGERTAPGNALCESLTLWSEADPRPLVVLIDEIDTLVGDTLISVLRQLRSGYDSRPGSFPQSVALCGVRDVRDYRLRSAAGNEVVTGGSAFNIKAASLRLGDFSNSEVRALLAQHSDETGQGFEEEALETVWRQTRGQPWLVNALANEACFRSRTGRDRTRTVTAEAILDAQEQIILRRETHLDQLADKLQEERVRRVVEPLLSGGDERPFSARDVEYVRDLGLVAVDQPLRLANPIYAEVVPRELTDAAQEGLVESTSWYVSPNGALDLDKLMAAFQAFFREHSEHWVERFDYKEAGPQLLLQAFLQRIVNGGGRIEREYGLGRRRTDLLIVWPEAAPASDPPGSSGTAPVDSAGRATRRYVIECKVLRRTLEQTLAEGLEQTVDYMDRCNAEAGHLVIFDRTTEREWNERIFRRDETLNGRAVTVWGM